MKRVGRRKAAGKRAAVTTQVQREIQEKLNAIHSGTVCFECGREVTEAEYSSGETTCCKSGVVPAEDFGKIDGFTGGGQ